MHQTVEIVLHFNGEEKILKAVFGKTLREVLLSEGFSPYLGKNALLNCHGVGICGTCIVRVLENGECKEKRSCQIQCFKPMEIELQ